jgi:hypothetical protein
MFASVLPNVYDEAQLREFAGASEAPPLTEGELRRVNELYEASFGLEPAEVEA